MTDTWIQTYTGTKFDPINPRPEDINIIDIAHALSHICRFTGHVKRFYSVAEHSTRMVDMFIDDDVDVRRWALLHDGVEAYIADLARPVKREIPEYQHIEAKIIHAIVRRFGLRKERFLEITVADNILLATEARDLLPGGPLENWTENFPEPLPDKINPVYSKLAKARFLRYARELGLE